MKSKTDKLGFLPGTASNLMVSAFKKYEKIATGDEQKKDKGHKTERDKEKASTVTQQTKNVSDTTSKHMEVSNEKKTSNRPNQDTEKPLNTSTEQSNTEVKDQSKLQQDLKDDSVPQKSNSENIEQDANPELARQQAIYQASSESYNGAIRDNYSWSQSITDLDICLKIPNYIKKGKDIKVCIEKKHIKVSHKDESGQMVELMNGELCWEINKEESIWNLVPAEHILINLDKKQERWWEAILTTEPKINVQKIDASRPMTDLDDEAQTKIEEMMFNERQKKLGLPQSHEKKVHDVLAQAWNAEGSPFKGQPFDPSKLNVGQGGMITINDSTIPMPIKKFLTTGEFGLAKVDLVIILDSSTSVREENYDKKKHFTKDLLVNSDIDGGNVRVGATSFSMRGFINFQLKDYKTKNDAFNAIDKIQYIVGSTNTADAIRLMRVDMLTADNGDRPDVKNIAIIITDGVSNVNAETTIPEAEKARDVGIHIYAIGIGLSNLTELHGIASVPAKDNSLDVQSFDELKGPMKILPSKSSAQLSTTTSFLESTTNDLCQGETLNITCPKNFVMSFDDANFGRGHSDSERCTQFWGIESTHCDHHEHTLKVLNDECHEQQTCLLPVNKAIFGNPCFFVTKYLYVKYHCKRQGNHEISDNSANNVQTTYDGKEIDIRDDRKSKLDRKDRNNDRKKRNIKKLSVYE
ncbi:unnamed protein product [Mytilus edulis]|uniref:Uncharacterized protein n=1 Tax=Mytilus edulis TaxID=6550 RepID=A0A8S3UWM7_MYTED|nr:unnamed protein product [Mytilus edulis]